MRKKIKQNKLSYESKNNLKIFKITKELFKLILLKPKKSKLSSCKKKHPYKTNFLISKNKYKAKLPFNFHLTKKSRN